MEMDELNDIDWDNLFPENEFLHILEDVPPSLEDDATTGNAKESTVESWIEELLMKDDDEHDINQAQPELPNDFDFRWSDLLLDTPQPSDEQLGSSDASPPLQNSNSSTCSNSEDYVVKINSNVDGSGEDVPNFESNGEKSENYKSGDDVLDLEDDDTDHNDPLSKKRKRQLRNRDAAMRSRERKKMYVKDLEIKSRYMEAECRRLGRLLQCCYAENHMLRISLGSAYGASMAKPESAVLSLESLLLVSLVWLMVNICLLHLLPPRNQDAVPHKNVQRKELESATAKGKGTKVTELWVTLSFIKSKRCRASRTKMKSDFERAVLCN